MKKQFKTTTNKQLIFPNIGENIQIRCLDIDKTGFGISNFNGFVFITPDLIPGETATVKIEYRKGSQWFTSIVERIVKSKNRQKAPCSYYRFCGSCSTQHIVYQEQIRLKIKHLEDVIYRIGKLDVTINLELVNAEEIVSYRNRAIIPFRKQKNGELSLGYYKRKTHSIINIDECLVLDERISKLIKPIKLDLESYNHQTNYISDDIKKIRQLVMRIGTGTGEILISIVSYKDIKEELLIMAKNWLNRWPDVKGITLNIQPEDNNLIFGKETIVLAGRDYIEESFCGLTIRLATTNFFQIYSKQAEKVVSLLIKWFSKDKTIKSIVDAYCGVGTISLPLAQNGFRVTGIEINKESIGLALINALINNISLVNFKTGNINSLISNYIDQTKGLVLDPPRKGLDCKLIEIIKNKLPKKIAYLSCNPATLARDLKLITNKNSYKVEVIYAIDFFPQTTHLECLALLNRINS